MQIQENHSLQHLNTFGLPAKARYFVEIANSTELEDLLKHSEIASLPKLILGGGSNILFTEDFSGLVIRIKILGTQIIKETSEHIYLKVGAGELWHDTVLFCIEHQFAGIENLSLIPGTVGAAPIQNIGAYGVELNDVFDSLEAVNIEDGKLHNFTQQDCHFGYRNSIFKNKLKNKFIISSVTLRLNKIPKFNTAYGDINTSLQTMGVTTLSIKAISDAVIQIRQTKLPDPKEIGNAGSFFKNPEVSEELFIMIKSSYPQVPHFPASQLKHIKLSAAWLIDQCGWKGVRRDKIGVHEKQALVLVNYGGGNGQAILQLAKDIQQSVIEKFNVHLEMEVNVIYSPFPSAK